MKIIVDDGICLQKKDLDLIFKVVGDDKIPKCIVDNYNLREDNNELSFIHFKGEEVVQFLDDFWFVVSYNDFIDFENSDIIQSNELDFHNLLEMRISYDKNKFLPKFIETDDSMDKFWYQMYYFGYFPKREEIKDYPLDMQLLFNKVKDKRDIMSIRDGFFDFELPENVYKPIKYSSKQLQRIYYEVLGDCLSFEDLKPLQNQFYTIFSRIDYTPEILGIIRKVLQINRFKKVDFINDGLIDVLCALYGKKNKLEEVSGFIVDDLYAIGYKKFDKFDSNVIFKNDIKIVKDVFHKILRSKLDDKVIEKLTHINYEMGEIARVTNKCDFKLNNFTAQKRDLFANMVSFIYLSPQAINYDYDFLKKAYEFLAGASDDFIKGLGYKEDYMNKYFIENFNISNQLLLFLYNEKDRCKLLCESINYSKMENEVEKD